MSPSQTPIKDDYIDKLHRLAEHIKAHPDEARAGVAKLSAAAQQPAGDIIKIFVSDKDAKTKYEEIKAIKDKLPAAVAAEIEQHKADLAHKIGLLTLHEILGRLEKLAAHIKAHPEEAKERILTNLSPAAQKPAGEILKIFCSDKDVATKHAEIKALKETLPSEVVGELNARKEIIAKRIGIVPLHHLAHTHSHSDYFEKLHRLAAHIKAHPDEARAGIAKLSEAAQKPAGEILKVFVSDKDDRAKYDEIQAIKKGLAPAVVAEIENHKTELAHKIGILTLPEILERLEKLAVHIRAHPEEARAGVARLSAEAQKPAGEIIKIFVDTNKDAATKHAEIKAINDSLPSNVLGEINAVKDRLAKRIGIAPLHHLGAHTHAHDEYADKLLRLAEHIRAHPDEARAGVAKLSEAAQKPAGEIIKIFVDSSKEPKAKYEEIQAIKEKLAAPVRAEIEQHVADVAHKIGILTLHEILERLEKLAEHIKAHPEEAKAGIATLSDDAKLPAAELIKIFVSDKDVKTKYEECQAIKARLSSEVLGEINARKEVIARKIGIAPVHALGNYHTHSHDDYLYKLRRLAEFIRGHPEETKERILKNLSAAAQKPAGEIVKIFAADDEEPLAKYEKIETIKAGLTPAVRAEIEERTAHVAHHIGLLTLHEILARLEKLADHIKAHPDEARAGVAKLSAAAQKPAGDIIKIFVSDKTPKEKWAECKAIKDTLSSEVLGEINAHKEEIAHKIGIVPLHYH